MPRKPGLCIRRVVVVWAEAYQPHRTPPIPILYRIKTMPHAAHNLHAFSFLMTALDLRGLFPGTRTRKASEPVPHWIDFLHPTPRA